MPAPLVRVDPTQPEAAAIGEAAAVLSSGGLVAFPTETVYGLGADALDARAVARLFEVKGRPADNPIIVHVASPTDVDALATHVGATARVLIDRFWPGPLTLVLPAAPVVPEVTRGGLPTVAVRMPAHAVALALIAAARRPVAAPSANRSGRPSPTTAQHVLADLGERIDLVLDAGPAPVGVESTVVDVSGTTPVLLRPGGLPLEALQAAVGAVALPAPGAAATARSPGTRYRHYAPRARVVLVEGRPDAGERVAAAVRRLWDEGLRVGAMVTSEGAAGVPAGAVVRVMGPRAAPEVIAANLFAQLRELDEAGLDAIVVEGVAERGLGRAVMDRLRRAAAGAG
ncbi:MAG: L-threonylcarbamoyladenylate synthase [Armatimonadota bacterium]|nr:L-threonylcarbamoyladenylate synthase [Armatimonadota bacterium]MDR7422921.1 L-threonylcarbamoyladenylate synthase [Armatimonadota bacterium]MDR7454697.1 L-threonylcarbamoyladenylate synthase [Armatimonadota bacterium]MDR7456332.1 L-threonylcarbamoyladenylate synthase [Armatimonadota bacterium]MDR7496728.1 L-threonylcarbamoyladenylate synthase [Armatimonadota bacterium]